MRQASRNSRWCSRMCCRGGWHRAGLTVRRDASANVLPNAPGSVSALCQFSEACQLHRSGDHCSVVRFAQRGLSGFVATPGNRQSMTWRSFRRATCGDIAGTRTTSRGCSLHRRVQPSGAPACFDTSGTGVLQGSESWRRHKPTIVISRLPS